MHVCPGPNCERSVSLSLLACRRHWSQVPKPLQRRVYAAWAGGEGAGTDEHAEACEAAIATMQP